ncbi:hypothetical protein P5673_023803 [Acropora cervicornis]|uniref:Uncharacterized protein n=1 Tax=Acropora cervicornis TaxID=6130 RepID=A0AAD9Q4N5_ACRCE|nr:hypothetical protein P5673_023803 [Acropora cervicornis]
MHFFKLEALELRLSSHREESSKRATATPRDPKSFSQIASWWGTGENSSNSLQEELFQIRPLLSGINKRDGMFGSRIKIHDRFLEKRCVML